MAGGNAQHNLYLYKKEIMPSNYVNELYQVLLPLVTHDKA